MKNIPIGELLKQTGYISEEQLQQALAAQKKDSSKRLGTVLMDLGYVTEYQMLDALSQKLQYQLIELGTYRVDLGAVEKIPKLLAQKYHLIAIDQSASSLTVAVNDPLNFYAIEDIRQIINQPLTICLADRKSTRLNSSH